MDIWGSAMYEEAEPYIHMKYLILFTPTMLWLLKMTTFTDSAEEPVFRLRRSMGGLLYTTFATNHGCWCY